MSFIVCVKTINRNTCLFYISLFLYLLSLLHYQGYLCQIRHQCNIAETGVILRLLCLHTNMLQFWIHHYPLEHWSCNYGQKWPFADKRRDPICAFIRLTDVASTVNMLLIADGQLQGWCHHLEMLEMEVPLYVGWEKHRQWEKLKFWEKSWVLWRESEKYRVSIAQKQRSNDPCWIWEESKKRKGDEHFNNGF